MSQAVARARCIHASEGRAPGHKHPLQRNKDWLLWLLLLLPYLYDFHTYSISFLSPYDIGLALVLSLSTSSIFCIYYFSIRIKVAL